MRYAFSAAVLGLVATAVVGVPNGFAQAPGGASLVGQTPGSPGSPAKEARAAGSSSTATAAASAA